MFLYNYLVILLYFSKDISALTYGAEVERVPYQVAIFSPVNNSIPNCNGALVAAQWVITSKKCVRELPIRLVLGATNIQEKEPFQIEVIISDAKFTFHPELPVDVALIYLTKKTILSSYIKPIIIGRSASHQEAMVTSWGDTGGHLKERFTVIKSSRRCYVKGSAKYRSSVGTYDLCTFGAACTGDTGAPLVTGHESGSLKLVGILSSFDSDCKSFSDFYIKLMPLQKWIIAVDIKVNEEMSEIETNNTDSEETIDSDESIESEESTELISLQSENSREHGDESMIISDINADALNNKANTIHLTHIESTTESLSSFTTEILVPVITDTITDRASTESVASSTTSGPLISTVVNISDKISSESLTESTSQAVTIINSEGNEDNTAYDVTSTKNNKIIKQEDENDSIADSPSTISPETIENTTDYLVSTTSTERSPNQSITLIYMISMFPVLNRKLSITIDPQMGKYTRESKSPFFVDLGGSSSKILIAHQQSKRPFHNHSGRGNESLPYVLPGRQIPIYPGRKSEKLPNENQQLGRPIQIGAVKSWAYLSPRVPQSGKYVHHIPHQFYPIMHPNRQPQRVQGYIKIKHLVARNPIHPDSIFIPNKNNLVRKRRDLIDVFLDPLRLFDEPRELRRSVVELARRMIFLPPHRPIKLPLP